MRTTFFATVTAIVTTCLVNATKLVSEFLLDDWQLDQQNLAETNSHALGYSDADIEADLEAEGEGEGDLYADIDLEAESDADGESEGE